MNKIIHKNTLALLAVMVMLMATLLTACGSSKAADTSAKEDTINVEVTKEAESAETTEAEEVAEIEPAVEEPTAEPTPEPVVYEGIDMESTLPVEEWVKTFDGVIEEPKIVILNDETNKKIIVENDQEIEFSESDTLLLYRPVKMEVYMESGQNDYEIFDEIESEKNYGTFKKLSVIVHDGDKVPLKYEFSGDGNDYTLTVTLIAKKSE